MRLHIVRHADPDYPSDSISEAGQKEAEALAQRIKKEGIDRLLCSPIARAKQTAEYVTRLTGIQPEYCDWLKEADWRKFVDPGFVFPFDMPAEYLLGSTEESTFDDWQKNPHFDAKKIKEDLLPRYEELDRFLASVGYSRHGEGYIEEKENMQDIYLFCHAGIGLALIAYLLHLPLGVVWLDFWLAPSSVTTILFTKRNGELVAPRCLFLNDVSHLEEAGLPIRPRGFKGSFH
jgi:broad specificity phosphatase PhoE